MRWLVVCTLLLTTTAARANCLDELWEHLMDIFRTFESVPYKVTRTAPGYEERLYEEQKWVCTQETKKSDPLNSLFWRLFQYISGHNHNSEYIAMTVPVTTEFTIQSASDKTYTMCYYLGLQHQDDPPAPLNSQVFIQERPQMTVLTRTVGGYLTSESDWMEEAGKLAAVIQENGETVSLNHMYWAGYDSPWKFWSRRNEVWFPVS